MLVYDFDTVRTRLATVYRKLGARNAPHAVTIAIARGLLPLSRGGVTAAD